MTSIRLLDDFHVLLGFFVLDEFILYVYLLLSSILTTFCYAFQLSNCIKNTHVYILLYCESVL